jgi:hypothetical protein
VAQGEGIVQWERGCPVQSEAIVTSWRPDRANPYGPAGDMPQGGTMVSALLLRAHPDADVFGSGRRFILEARVAIKERRPRPGMLARAQAVVDQLRLPRWITSGSDEEGLDFKCT